jgi:hypothetical protein
VLGNNDALLTALYVRLDGLLPVRKGLGVDANMPKLADLEADRDRCYGAGRVPRARVLLVLPITRGHMSERRPFRTKSRAQARIKLPSRACWGPPS